MASSIKRPVEDTDNKGPAPKKFHWSKGLLTSMDDPALKVETDEKIVIIRDKYPKAKYHFLVLPLEHIPNLKFLKSHHNELLQHMETKARLLAAKYPSTEFRFGYHAIPSMSQIHLHVISQDFSSPCMKTKRHWNSFNSKYFLDSTDVIRCLEERGMVVTMTPVAGEKLLSQPLKCHKCVYSPQNIPKLKQHLLKHFKPSHEVI